MGYFTIDLPENKKGEVRWGNAFNMHFSFFHKSKSESKKGYIVNVADDKSKTIYRLFKSPNGDWSKDPEGKAPLDDHMLILIKNAIIERENKLSDH